MLNFLSYSTTKKIFFHPRGEEMSLKEGYLLCEELRDENMTVI